MRASMSNLVRTLGLRDIYLLTIGSVIGSGIFLVPATILMQVHLSVGLALLVWIAGGVLSLLGALTYGELGAMNPAAGGLYVYIRDAFGSLPAFLYGWALFLVIASGTNAALAVAFSTYLGEIIPLSHLGAQLVGFTMLALLTVLNVLGTQKKCGRTELVDDCENGWSRGNERHFIGLRTRIFRDARFDVARAFRWRHRRGIWTGDDWRDVGL